MVSPSSVKYLLCCSIFTSIQFSRSNARIENTTQPEVTILPGSLQGITLTTRYGRNISAFLRIPYAQPPVGNLRFANPVAADAWNETFKATESSISCPQYSNSGVVGEEDCLHINVYTPQLPENESSSLLPVMVFIHGGAFSAESSTNTNYGPEYLLDKDVVLAAPNYRLGPLGFLSTGDEVASGNWGLKDQVLALKWVQDNIAFFGGDPDQVTLVGESAGSASVHLLTLSKSTTGLFHRYITQSGSALSVWAHRPRAAYASRAFELGEYVGCSKDTSDSLITCLRTIDFSRIIETRTKFYEWWSHPDIVWGPTDEPDIEGAILTDSPTNLFNSEGIRDLPWLSGVVRDEGMLMTISLYEDEEMYNEFWEQFEYVLPLMLSLTYQSDSGSAWVDAIKSFYFNNDFTANKSVLLENLTNVISDALFFYPAFNAMQQQLVLAENPQYFYTFNYRGTWSFVNAILGSTADYGVVHGDDLIYLFPSDSTFAEVNGTLSNTDFEMVDTMVQLWTSFAINGTPTISDLNDTTIWEPFSSDVGYLCIGNESDVALEMQYSFFEARMQFWESLFAAPETLAVTPDGSSATTSMPNILFILSLLSLEFVLASGIFR